jgi:hypothetical protein
MHAHPPGGAEDDLVDDRRAGIDQQVASSCRVHHITDMASVHPLDHDEMLLAKKGACTTWISIATGDLMALAPKQFGNQGTSCSDTQDKNPHEGLPTHLFIMSLLISVPHPKDASKYHAQAMKVTPQSLRTTYTRLRIHRCTHVVCLEGDQEGCR